KKKHRHKYNYTMIINIGLDIIEKKRIKKLIYKYKKQFIRKILSNKEQSIFKNKSKKIEFLSKIFSLKETISKTLGTGFINKITFNKIKISNNKLGKPIANKIFNNKIILSASHEKHLTITLSIILKITYT
ncbi:MAG: holo-ACP synthase, partial [Candidatus Riesia sp.]|nr:holo-ACP synthase [Candidatus Riesia sp.]